MNEKIKKLLKEYKHNVKNIVSKKSDCVNVFNSEWNIIDYNEVKYILVGDNPGIKEKLSSRYLVGQTGLSTRVFFERFIVDSFSQVLVLQKTPIFTNKTGQLNEIDNEVLEQTQKLSVHLLFDISNLINVKIIIMGYSNGFNSSAVLNNGSCRYFFEELIEITNKNEKFFNKIYIIPHFSSCRFYDHFTLDDYDNFELALYKLGIQNRIKFLLKNELREAFTKKELETLRYIRKKDRNHPTKYLVFNKTSDLLLFERTNRALRLILDNDIDWYNSNKSRLLDKDDFSSSSSFLAEIRTYGELLNIGFDIKSIRETSNPTPDFKVSFEGQELFIEVHAKQYSKDISEKLEAFNKLDFKDGNKKVRIKGHVITPMGKPKKNENITENAISKICGIKSKDHQMSEDRLSILWLDLQDELWSIAFDATYASPISSFNGKFYAGVLWYALFGKLGMPIFEGESTEFGLEASPVQMRHNGRFIVNTELNAVVFSLKKDIIVIENPFKTKRISSNFWKELSHHRFFNLEYSLTFWQYDDLKKMIELQTSMIEKLSKEKLFKS